MHTQLPLEKGLHWIYCNLIRSVFWWTGPEKFIRSQTAATTWDLSAIFLPCSIGQGSAYVPDDSGSVEEAQNTCCSQNDCSSFMTDTSQGVMFPLTAHPTSQDLLGTQKLCLPSGVLMQRSLVGHEISSPSMSQKKCHVLRKWNGISCITCPTGQANTVLEELLKGPQVFCRWVNS